ncbi:hypothetical protein [Bradyrhizobium sp. dw_78]|uniref:hypothetical protein n=1 Tax=Bradyrhizobium sp. dw_78 TaxID=2719793 RepID=UPI001BD40670|nr:hypothetical protein [Bradyrhizobium sp. dw_78]
MTESFQEPFLRRMLLKTKPVPYPIWMAVLGAITISVAMVPGILVYRPSVTVVVKIVLLFGLCLGGLMGLFVVQQMNLPWLATFGEVIEKDSKPVPKENKQKKRTLVTVVFAVLVVVIPLLLGYCVGALR